jgi:cysteinyl-tRNA synthetase
MGKSLGNFITLEELFAGTHVLLTQAYSPMTIRFFILQAHYRSTLDFSNEALQAAEKALQRIGAAQKTLGQLPTSAHSTVNVSQFKKACFEALDDDLNTAVALSAVFEWIKNINAVYAGAKQITAQDLQSLQEDFALVLHDVLGLDLNEANSQPDNSQLTNDLIKLLLQLRQQAKAAKDYATGDHIRNQLAQMGVTVRDIPQGESEFIIEHGKH